MIWFRISWASLLFLPILCCFGCAGAAVETLVSGTVTYDGTLVETGSIAFIPLDGNAKTTGGNIVAGKYSTRVPVGKMKVQINGDKVTGEVPLFADNPKGPKRPIVVQLLPKKYNTNTELTLEVAGKKLQHDWNLPK